MLLLNIPNCLTLLRILCIPIFVISFFKAGQGITTVIFVIAALTDWLDGYLARKFKQISLMGAFLDPVADKLIVSVALILLVQSYSAAWLTIPAIIIVSREIIVSALREWMSSLNKRHHVAVNQLGKFKTVSQVVAISLLLSQDPAGVSMITWVGGVLMYSATLLTLWSMAVYLQLAWRGVTSANN